MVDRFGEALRQLRKDRGWSLAQLAQHVRWSKSVLADIETGLQQPSVEQALACDRVFETFPILTTLCGLERKDDDVRRRALMSGFAAAMGVGALTSLAAFAEVIRLDVQEAAGIEQDWDAEIRSFQRRLVTAPSATFGDELLASTLTARQRMTERRDPDATRASAHFGLLYGIWMGYLGNINTGQNQYRTAALLAERSGDRNTQVYVLARIASGGPYQGLSRAETENNIAQALALAGDRPSTGALEAHAATVHLAALTGDLASGRSAMQRMQQLLDRLDEPPDEPAPAQRTASFAVYLEGRLGTLNDAQRAIDRARPLLAPLPQWQEEAQLYWALALIRHGLAEEGLQTALAAVRSVPYPIRTLRLGVDDVLRTLPPGYRSELSEELRQHGTTGPKPWELIRA